MAVICDRARVVYLPVPKVACTSLKVLFWELNNGRPRPQKLPLTARLRRKLGQSIEGETLQTEPGYRTLNFDPGIDLPDGYDRIAVIRDPLARLCSAWSNKVDRELFKHHNELAKLKEHRLSDSPTFAEFIDHFDDYRAVSVPVRRHTGSFSQYLGEDLNWFSRIFKMEKLNEFENYLRERIDDNVQVPLRNQSQSARRSSRLEKSHVSKLERILASDYRLLSGHYSLNESIDRFL